MEHDMDALNRKMTANVATHGRRRVTGRQCGPVASMNARLGLVAAIALLN